MTGLIGHPEEPEVETEELLKQWGRWVRDGGVSLGANSVFMLGSTVPTPMITDDHALLIDGIVARLKLRDPFGAKVIRIYYVQNITEAEVAKRLKKSRNTILGIRKAGVAWIDGVLDSIYRRQDNLHFVEQ